MNKLVGILVILLMAGCEPADTTPGLWLSGTLRPFPEGCKMRAAHGATPPPTSIE